METIKKMTKERAELLKKAKETETLKKNIGDKNKEISNLKAEVKTKDGLIAIAKAKSDNDQSQAHFIGSEEVTVHAEVKQCKKCNFTAPNLQILSLHIENDHHFQFDCNECGKKFPFKNQLKIHKREVHEEGSFACFVCNAKFKTHKELKQHIHKKCKSNANPSPNKIVHRHNEDILEEDEHRCPKCPKITNNQVSLVHHMNTVHMVITEKCDTCGLEFQNREVLIKHIVDNHTQKSTHIISRFICKVCNVELHGEMNKESHMCRKPQWGCDWCKQEFYSSEARKNHICDKHKFKTVDEQLRARRRSQTECNNGVDCWRAARNKCWFKHSLPINIFPQEGHSVYVQQERVQERQVQPDSAHRGQLQEGQGHPGQRRQEQQRDQGQGQPGAGARPQLYCRFQEICFKGDACKFKHFQLGFPLRNPVHNQH